MKRGMSYGICRGHSFTLTTHIQQPEVDLNDAQRSEPTHAIRMRVPGCMAMKVKPSPFSSFASCTVTAQQHACQWACSMAKRWTLCCVIPLGPTCQTLRIWSVLTTGQAVPAFDSQQTLRPVVHMESDVALEYTKAQPSAVVWSPVNTADPWLTAVGAEWLTGALAADVVAV